MAESVGECLEEDGVSQELELLENVYLDDLQVLSQDRAKMELLFHVTPNTGEHVYNKHVYLNLHFMLTQQYPVHPVEITIPASRGISESHLKEILTALTLRAATLTGSPMMYELVEYAKDSLTNNNLPCDNCIVCLQPFHDGDHVARTDCYHYFHTKCLTRYYKFYKRQQQQEDAVPGPIVDPSHKTKPKSLECPVCRHHIPPDATCLEAVAHLTTQQSQEEEEEEKVHISQEVRHWQQQMAKLHQQQEKKGGLIDVRANDGVIDVTWVRPVAPSVSSSGQKHENHEETQYECEEVLIGSNHGGTSGHKQEVYRRERRREQGCDRRGGGGDRRGGGGDRRGGGGDRRGGGGDRRGGGGDRRGGGGDRRGGGGDRRGGGGGGGDRKGGGREGRGANYRRTS